MSKRPVAVLLQQAQQATHGGDHGKAIKLLRKAAKDQPNSPEIAQHLADALVASGQGAEAVTILRRALARSPEQVPLHASLVAAERSTGNMSQALQAAHDLVELAGDRPDSWQLLGQTQMAASDIPAAYQSLEHAHGLEPDNLEILGLLADAQVSHGTYPVAITHAEDLARLQPNRSRNHSRLGNGLRMNNRFDEAIASFDQALALDRHNLEAVAGKAEVLESQGRTEEAIDLVKPRVYTGQTSFLLLSCWTRLCQRTRDYAAAIGPLEQFIAAGRASAWHRSHLLIRLGQLYEKVGRHDEAFQAWTVGNRPHRGRWNADAHEQLVDTIIETFSAEAMNTLPRSTLETTQPVFVLGMFRSGTTLTEQILSAHPRIAGAGELGQMLQLTHQLPEHLGSPYPGCISSVTSELLTTLAQSYCDDTHQMADDADRITDKMPMNYLHVGLISLLFPNARIIHTTRDPLDTCISCYGNAFSSQMAYTSDLTDLGRTWRQYRRLMDHWESVKTIPMMELNYESLIAEPETQLRSVLAFLDVPWDDACLSFHESKRINITPSVDQVREPLYTASIGRAANFRAHLGELESALQ
ncbi:MAG: sulfotransferase [Phycisphaerales bacterium]|nr:sulfotransferase [Phycisphaerales bacterium]